MTYKNYVENMKNIQSLILQILDDNENDEENFKNFNTFVEDNKMDDDQEKIKSILYLISKIADNHHRQPHFFNKFEQILQIFKEKMIFYFTSQEIYDFFKNNKPILLYLIESKTIKFDEVILKQISKDKYKSYNYPKYFAPEVNYFFNDLAKELDDDDDECDDKTEESEDFYSGNRENGENNNYLCKLIRNDILNEFMTNIKDKYSSESIIESSIYESNLFLLKNNQTTLIEYSAFFGSLKIFKYLFENSNKANFSQKIWLYAIHSNCLELILYLKQNLDKFEKISFNDCLKEAIKCHHNEIANFIQTNFLDQNEIMNKTKENYKDNIYSYGFHYHNFFYFPAYLINNNFIFYYACEFDYFDLVKFLMKIKVMDVNLKIIPIH